MKDGDKKFEEVDSESMPPLIPFGWAFALALDGKKILLDNWPRSIISFAGLWLIGVLITVGLWAIGYACKHTFGKWQSLAAQIIAMMLITAVACGWLYI